MQIQKNIFVCKYFKHHHTSAISNKFFAVFSVLDKLDFAKYSITSLLNIPIQYYYLIQLTEFNAIFWTTANRKYY